ncbi:MAG: sigma-70 family RNA polymerase sigma factor [Acidobacteriota bacterium]
MQTEARPQGTPAVDPALLLERIQAGDSEAEDRLVELFQRGVRLLLRRLVGDPALVDDLVQETFALVIAKARRGEILQPDRLSGFVRSTARNLLIADRRREARYVSVEDSETMSHLAQQAPVRPTSSEPEPAPLDRMLREEEGRLVRQLLDELRFDRDRELLIRFYLTEDEKERLCSDLSIAPEHFRRVLFRARQRLRELWEQWERQQGMKRRATG